MKILKNVLKVYVTNPWILAYGALGSGLMNFTVGGLNAGD